MRAFQVVEHAAPSTLRCNEIPDLAPGAGQVRVGIKAPKEVRIVRSELAAEIAKTNQSSAVEVKLEEKSCVLSAAARSVPKAG